MFDGKFKEVRNNHRDEFWANPIFKLQLFQLYGRGCPFLPEITDRKIGRTHKGPPMEIKKGHGNTHGSFFIYENTLTRLRSSATKNEWGPLTMPGFPWEFSETPASWRLPAPELREHTESIKAGIKFPPFR